MSKIIVLDNSTGSVHVFPFDKNVYDTEDLSEFYDHVNEFFQLSLSDSECSWMIVLDLKISIH